MRNHDTSLASKLTAASLKHRRARPGLKMADPETSQHGRPSSECTAHSDSQLSSPGADFDDNRFSLLPPLGRESESAMHGPGDR